MRSAPVCPRCGAPVRAPGVWSSGWTCGTHGLVDPLHPAPRAGAESFAAVVALAAAAELPVWLPWPLPDHWLVTGVRWAGDERTGARAVAVACSGPAPLGGMGELVLVAEALGVGLGAGLAAHDGPDADERTFARAPDTKLVVGGHPAPLWSVGDAADRAVFVGEARGHWLWAVLWPAAAGHLVAERLNLVDLARADPAPDLPMGALSPRLVPGPLR